MSCRTDEKVSLSWRSKRNNACPEVMADEEYMISSATYVVDKCVNQSFLIDHRVEVNSICSLKRNLETRMHTRAKNPEIVIHSSMPNWLCWVWVLFHYRCFVGSTLYTIRYKFLGIRVVGNREQPRIKNYLDRTCKLFSAQIIFNTIFCALNSLIELNKNWVSIGL